MWDSIRFSDGLYRRPPPLRPPPPPLLPRDEPPEKPLLREELTLDERVVDELLLDDEREVDELLLDDVEEEEEDERVTVERPVELWRTPLSVRRALLLSDVVLTREGACVCVPVAREVEGEVAVCVLAAELPARILLTRPKEEALMDVGRAVVARPVELLFTPPCVRPGAD
jgi:hypothetical protein